jgi:hypothetical protein
MRRGMSSLNEITEKQVLKHTEQDKCRLPQLSRDNFLAEKDVLDVAEE